MTTRPIKSNKSKVSSIECVEFAELVEFFHQKNKYLINPSGASIIATKTGKLDDAQPNFIKL